MESQLNFISEQQPWKNLSEKYYGIQTYLKEAIAKSIMFDIQPHLLLDDDDKIDDVVKYVLNTHSRDIPGVMQNVSKYFNLLLQFVIFVNYFIYMFPKFPASEWYFSSLGVTEKSFQLERSIFSFHVEMFF